MLFATPRCNAFFGCIWLSKTSQPDRRDESMFTCQFGLLLDWPKCSYRILVLFPLSAFPLQVSLESSSIDFLYLLLMFLATITPRPCRTQRTDKGDKAPRVGHRSWLSLSLYLRGYWMCWCVDVCSTALLPTASKAVVNTGRIASSSITAISRQDSQSVNSGKKQSRFSVHCRPCI